MSNHVNHNAWISSEAKPRKGHANLTRRRVNDPAQETRYRRILNKDEDIVQTTNALAETKVSVVRGKSNFTNYLYMYHVLDYCFNNQDKCSCHIIYFALEESVSKVIERYMSHLLFQLDGLRIPPTDLRSTSPEFPVPKEALDLFSTEPYKKRLEFFEKCVEFNTEDTNPTGILRVCEAYAKSVGTYKSHKMESKSGNGNEVEVFDSYEQDDPNHYKIVIIDHIGLVDKEQGFNTKAAIDKTSEYFVKYLRNRYNYTCVAIQQQASEMEGLEAVKMKKMIPSASGGGDSKYTFRDCDLAIGLFDPSKFGLPSWLGYKINDLTDGEGLKNYARFAYVIANRNGEMGGVCPLFFDGAVCDFQELPLPTDPNVGLWYFRADQLRSFKQKKKAADLKSLSVVSLVNIKVNGRRKRSTVPDMR